MTDLDSTLELFAPASTEDSARAALQERMTIKFLLPTTALSPLLREIAREYTLLFAGNNRAAMYRSLHFDTPDLAFFHAHRRGYRRRQKVRIRHYDDRKLAFFEIKQRVSEFKTVKLRRERPFGDNLLGDEDLALLCKNTPVQGPMLPQVWTIFQRLNLVNVAARERVTVDFDLQFRSDDKEVKVRNGVVVEVKQLRLNPHTPVMIALRNGGFRSGSFSKYCAAIVALHPLVRNNRLLPQLRVLERMDHG